MHTFQKLLLLAAMMFVAFIGNRYYASNIPRADRYAVRTGEASEWAAQSFPFDALPQATIAAPLIAQGADEPLPAPSLPVAPPSAAVLTPQVPSARVAEERTTGSTMAEPVSVVAPAPVQKPKSAATIAALSDLSSDELLLDQDVGRRWPIASITKLFTAAVAVRTLPFDQEIALVSTDFDPDPEATNGGVQPGERYTVHDLLKLMLLTSSNAAANALARASDMLTPSGSFVAELNARASGWGLRETNLADPSGLSVADQSTARDLIRFARVLSTNYADVLAITRMASATVTDRASGAARTIQNINHFAGQPGFGGGKTGYTPVSNGTLLSLFSVNGRVVATVVLGSSDRFGDTEALLALLRANSNIQLPNSK